MINKKLKDDIFIFVSFVLISIALNIFLNNIPDWDFLSYHYYNGWAFWHNRFNIDFMPCHFRSYFNPILDGISYLFLEKLNNFPTLFLTLIKIKYAVLLFLAYKFYNFIFKENEFNKVIAHLFCLTLAGASPIIIYCNNFGNTDIDGAILTLFALILFLKQLFNLDTKKRNWKIFIALAICGAAVGLKYTNTPCVAGLFIATILLSKTIDKPLKTLGIMLAGATFGLLLTDGYWMFLLWQKFQNPFFPYFNEIFKSPMANNDSILAMDFSHLKAKSILEYLLMPFNNPKVFKDIGFEGAFFDLKMILGFISIILLFCSIKSKNLIEKISNIIDVKILYFLAIFTIFSYYINLTLFGNLRYLIILFLILPIFIYVVIRQFSNQKFYKYILLIIFLLFSITYKGTPRIDVNFNGSQKVIKFENMQIEDDSTILCSYFLTASFAPMQNENVKYVGFILPQDLINKGYYKVVEPHYNNSYYSNKYLEKVISKSISESKNLYIVISELSAGQNYADIKLYEEALNRYSNGKFKEINNCKKINYSAFENQNFYKELKLCKLK
jgi:hypothetical protein